MGYGTLIRNKYNVLHLLRITHVLVLFKPLSTDRSPPEPTPRQHSSAKAVMGAELSPWSFSDIIGLATLLATMVLSPIGWLAHRYWALRGESGCIQEVNKQPNIADQKQACPQDVTLKVQGRYHKRLREFRLPLRVDAGLLRKRMRQAGASGFGGSGGKVHVLVARKTQFEKPHVTTLSFHL